MTKNRLVVGNDNLITIGNPKLRDAKTGALVTDAALTYTLTRVSTSAQVATGSLTYEASDGNYYGDIPATTTLVVGEDYALRVTGASSGRDVDFRRTYQAVERDGVNA